MVKLLAAVASELVLCVSKSRWVLIFQPPLNIYANKIISVAIVCWDVLTLLAVVVFAHFTILMRKFRNCLGIVCCHHYYHVVKVICCVARNRSTLSVGFAFTLDDFLFSPNVFQTNKQKVQFFSLAWCIVFNNNKTLYLFDTHGFFVVVNKETDGREYRKKPLIISTLIFDFLF